MTRLLVCPPTHFGVEYVINPWMAGNIGAASQANAMRQWDELVEILEDHADVYAIEPEPGLPDMCFAANGGLVLDETFLPSTFGVAQREGESALYRAWAEAAGFVIADGADALPFEGEGDALWWPAEGNSRPVLWAGYGVRTSLEAHRTLTEELRVAVVSLRLVDQRFYHLDTCFVPLPGGRVIYYPAAFDEASRLRIESLVPAERRIEVGDEDAFGFACNAVRLGDTFITSHATGALRKALGAWGYEVVTTPLTEFIKAGGAAKCLTLLLDQDLPDDFGQRSAVESPIRSQMVELEGHLLDEGVMARLRRGEPGRQQLSVGTVPGRRAQRPDESRPVRGQCAERGPARRDRRPARGFRGAGGRRDRRRRATPGRAGRRRARRLLLLDHLPHGCPRG